MRAKIDNILEKLVLLILTIMLLSVVWQVFSRFILGAPSTITDEISSFSLIWIGLLGAAYATGKHLHLAIDLIPEHVVAKKQSFFDGIVYLSTFFFAFIVMVIGGIRLCQLSFQFGQTSATLEIPLGIVYLVVPISGILICYYTIDTLINKRKLNKA
ncbi:MULTISPECIES: TRAP transporter small permease [Polaribacter]|uniref:C4-dicarboxylate ABC transporter permease n=1 Tax=Polaribacter sejongensis TaxID=985043 RepID=A0AAJ1QSX6_9FLAO|nr:MULTISPECIES: TRAP transporter small permease [Polaribacter]AUC23615.1 C4-dicarboxylate ABC transporter permease [Polaribacter sejongensis]MDN3617835.1 TRAP transporter small permease [Polaribacter undariae]UWD32158.1 TRAP transporter small permease [Polaribacter undariae]